MLLILFTIKSRQYRKTSCIPNVLTRLTLFKEQKMILYLKENINFYCCLSFEFQLFWSNCVLKYLQRILQDYFLCKENCVFSCSDRNCAIGTFIPKWEIVHWEFLWLFDYANICALKLVCSILCLNLIWNLCE